MKLRAAVVALCVCITACGEETQVPVAATPACSAGATIAVATTGGAQDFSALDPAQCPPIVPEELDGVNPRAPLVMPASVIEGKAFYVLALLDVVADARLAVSTWPTLATLAAAHTQTMQAAVTGCNG
ncbi:MAG: hypothetical protein ACHQ4J_16325, partial [Candidatus Binatia bacterium]